MKTTLPESSGTKVRSDQSKRLIPWFVIVLMAGIYALLFPWLHWNFGISGRAFALSYIFLAAWFWGLRGAVIVGILNIPFVLVLAKAINVELPGFPMSPFLSVVIGAVLGLFRDLTLRLKEQLFERRQVEKELRESEKLLSMALEGADEGLWDYYLQTGETYFSPRWYTMLDYEADEFPHIFESWTELLHPEDRPRIEKRLLDFLEDHEKQYSIEFRMRTKGGGWRWIFSKGKAVEWDNDGNTTRMVGTHADITDRKKAEEELKKHRDHLEELVAERTKDLLKTNEELTREITEHKRAEEALRESEKKFRNLVDISPTAISIMREDQYFYVNSSWEDLTGYSKEEAQTLNPLMVVHPDMREQVRSRAAARIKGKQVPERYELKGIKKDGGVVWFDAAVTVIQYDNEPAILNTAADITDRKRAEEDREGLINELQNALDNIKTLRGLLPICAKCKKIRDDKGYWKQIEGYIETHTDALFSHGICPECMDTLYGDDDWYKKMS